MAEQTLKEKTAKGLFWGGFGLMLARILDASDYGMVGMLAIFSAIASTIQESGFTAALTNQKEIRHEDYNAVFWFSTLTGVSFYLILFFCAPLIAQFDLFGYYWSVISSKWFCLLWIGNTNYCLYRNRFYVEILLFTLDSHISNRLETFKVYV